MQKTFSPLAKLSLVTSLALACLPLSPLHAQTATSTPIETINFGVTPTGVGAQAAAQATEVPDLYISVDDVVSLTLRSYAPATTPIEIYFLIFDTTDAPVRKFTVATVKNPVVGAFKKYRIVMNKKLLDSIVVGKAEYFKLGYCIGGCGTPGANKLIKGKIILPRKLPPSSDSLAI